MSICNCEGPKVYENSDPDTITEGRAGTAECFEVIIPRCVSCRHSSHYYFAHKEKSNEINSLPSFNSLKPCSNAVMKLGIVLTTELGVNLQRSEAAMLQRSKAAI